MSINGFNMYTCKTVTLFIHFIANQYSEAISLPGTVVVVLVVEVVVVVVVVDVVVEVVVVVVAPNQ